ncbi:MAG: hypothetical protein ACREBS_02145 [Nitrososphaerales archaeon]
MALIQFEHTSWRSKEYLQMPDQEIVSLPNYLEAVPRGSNSDLSDLLGWAAVPGSISFSRVHPAPKSLENNAFFAIVIE